MIRNSGMRAIGVDVGGSKASVGLIDTMTGTIIDRVQIPTPALEETGPPFLTALADAAQTLQAREALPVGIGICEIVEGNGEIVSAHRVRWTSAEVRAAFPFAKGVAIEADVRAAAIAEARFGAGRGLVHWIYANAGTGIATVLMAGDWPYPGAHGRAVAAGMSPADFASKESAAPTVEEIAGGAGMLARARGTGLGAANVAELLDQARADVGTSRAIVAEGGFVLGRMLGLLANALDPEAVVLGGGIAAASPEFVEACRVSFRDSVWYAEGGVPQMPVARFGSDSGLIGAAVCALRVER